MQCDGAKSEVRGGIGHQSHRSCPVRGEWDVYWECASVWITTSITSDRQAAAIMATTGMMTIFSRLHTWRLLGQFGQVRPCALRDVCRQPARIQTNIGDRQMMTDIDHRSSVYRYTLLCWWWKQFLNTINPFKAFQAREFVLFFLYVVSIQNPRVCLANN
jgi:hypothetical protein